MKKIAILCSTGSIGTQTLEIVRENPDLKVTGRAAGSNAALMEKQIREFGPDTAGMLSEKAAEDLKNRVSDLNVRGLCGIDGLLELAAMDGYEVLVTAVVGMIGIRPTIAAIESGKTIALANKETLVTAGHLIMPLAKKHGAVSYTHLDVYKRQSLWCRSSWTDSAGNRSRKRNRCSRNSIMFVTEQNTKPQSVPSFPISPGQTGERAKCRCS